MAIYARHDGEWYSVGEGGSGGLSWGDFTTNGDETTSDTWGPDAQGRMWKYAEWDAANDYTVNLTGGLYHVLTCSGGSGGGQSTSDAKFGQPGVVSEGYWEFSANPNTPIVVGAKGNTTTNASPAVGAGGKPSAIGNYGTQGVISWGDPNIGRGSVGYTADVPDRVPGYKSFITGVETEYATGYQANPPRPGQGRNNASEQTDGCVIIATAAPNAKALNWVHTTYHAEVVDGTVTAVYRQKHYADGKTTPLPTGELVEASYGVGEGWLFVNGELQPPPTPPEPTRDELIEELQARIVELQKDTK